MPSTHPFSRTLRKTTDKCHVDGPRKLIRFLARGFEHQIAIRFGGIGASACESGQKRPENCSRNRRFFGSCSNAPSGARRRSNGDDGVLPYGCHKADDVPKSNCLPLGVRSTDGRPRLTSLLRIFCCGRVDRLGKDRLCFGLKLLEFPRPIGIA
jgi:hypothetical protein